MSCQHASGMNLMVMQQKLRPISVQMMQSEPPPALPPLGFYLEVGSIYTGLFNSTGTNVMVTVREITPPPSLPQCFPDFVLFFHRCPPLPQGPANMAGPPLLPGSVGKAQGFK